MMNNTRQNAYTPQDLEQLHVVLTDILQEICRVCELLGIQCFTLGGTAIGAYYFNGFVKWDDDIDLGMKRADYDLFVKEAPGLIAKGFFVQTLRTEPLTPFYFTKVRKDNTLFVQEPYKDLPIHHGIFVDILPLDNVPDNPLIARIHRRMVCYFEGSFLRRQCKLAILEGQQRLPERLSRRVASIRFALLKLVPKRFLHWRLHKACALFNGAKCHYVDVIKSSVDRIATESVNNPLPVQFEGIYLFAPKDLPAYLHYHYPDLKSPDMLESLWISHAPYKLSFDSDYHK